MDRGVIAVIPVLVELSGENRVLARGEASAAAEALGGREAREFPPIDTLVALELPDREAARGLAARLSLARRCLVPLDGMPTLGDRLEVEGRSGRTAAVRRIGSPSGQPDPVILEAGRRYAAGGGRIELRHPERRFWLARDAARIDRLFEEVGTIDRRQLKARRMPALPFQRPVTLPPHLARAATNLARVRRGDRVLDPFVGTGALLAEAGLLGARVYGIDRNATMVRGALRNLAYIGVAAEAMIEGDAGAVDFEEPGTRFDAIVTDPPYGRSSSTAGEPADRLVARVVPRWAREVAPGGFVVVIVPAGATPIEGVGPLLSAIPSRVHRSLTREFRVYRRPS